VEAGKVKSVTLFQGSSITGTFVKGNKTQSFHSFGDTGSANDPLLNQFLKEHDVSISIKNTSEPMHAITMVSGFIFLAIPILFLILLIVILLKINRILRNQEKQLVPEASFRPHPPEYSGQTQD
jgi:ATP-dependent Zn protease